MKGKVFHQEFNVTNANSSPDLLSRDACFRMEVLQNCFAVTGKEIHPPQPEPVIKMSQSTESCKKMEEGMHAIDSGSVRKSPLTKQKILDVNADVFEGLQEPYKFRLKEKLCACKTCTQKSSYPSTRQLSSRNIWSCQTRSVRRVGHFHWMGELFCHIQERCFHGQWKFPCSMSSNQEEATNLFRSKRSQWSMGMWALLFVICGWANRKIPWM